MAEFYPSEGTLPPQPDTLGITDRGARINPNGSWTRSHMSLPSWLVDRLAGIPAPVVHAATAPERNSNVERLSTRTAGRRDSISSAATTLSEQSEPRPDSWQHLSTLLDEVEVDEPSQGEERTPLQDLQARLIHSSYFWAGPFTDSPEPFLPSAPWSLNLDLGTFLRHWIRFEDMQNLPRPDLLSLDLQLSQDIKKVAYSDLCGDHCDFQGLNWASMGLARSAARQARRDFYRLHILPRLSAHQPRNIHLCPPEESYYRFQCMSIHGDAFVGPLPTRNLLACRGRDEAFYVSQGGVTRVNLITNDATIDIDLKDLTMSKMLISLIDARRGILASGNYEGFFAIKSLNGGNHSVIHEYQVPDNHRNILKHLSIERGLTSDNSRLIVADNECGMYVFDIAAERFIFQRRLQWAVNCTSSAVDQRRRLVVGNSPRAEIIDSATGFRVSELRGHSDDIYACDWSEDQVTIATGSNDQSVKIWDVRQTSEPIHTLSTEVGAPCSLKFSPLGSGKSVLAMAEAADIVSIYDAIGFNSKQTFEFFSEIGGMEFSNQGQDLSILCGDKHRGGIMRLQRCGLLTSDADAEDVSPDSDFDDDNMHRQHISSRFYAGPVF